MSDQSKSAKTASDLVRPFNQQLGEWQARSVKLQTLVARSGCEDRIIDDLEALLREVAEEAKRFEALASKLEPLSAEHTRVTDTRRSFRMVIDRLVAARAYWGAN